MESPLLIATKDDLDAAIKEQVRVSILSILPEAVRRATLPEYLTKRKLQELTGWSDRQIAYKKSRREIPFIKRGRLVLFPTEDVFAYLEEGRVAARGEAR